MKTCIIKQPAGLGDILFCQKIAAIIQDKYKPDRIIWPVCTQYNYLTKYITNGIVEFIPECQEFPYKEIYNNCPRTIINQEDLIYVPLYIADQLIPQNRGNIYVKYDLCGDIDCVDWQDYFTLNRDVQKEQELFNKLNPNNKPYYLINNSFGTPPNCLYRTDLPKSDNLLNIYMHYTHTPCLFDWCMLMEKAEKVVTVDTSIAFILSKLKISNVSLYIRSTQHTPFDKITHLNERRLPTWQIENE